MQHHALAQQVAAAVQQRYASLPKNGKPQPHEHTVLAGIVAYVEPPQDHQDHQQQQQQLSVHVIAIGTGTKCLGGSKRSAAGDVLNDSHAEAITRRAFVAWAHQQLAQAAQLQRQPAAQQPQEALAAAGPGFVWCPTTRKFKLRCGVRFGMFVSQPPCGDASIWQQQQQQQQQQAGEAASPTAAAAGGSPTALPSACAAGGCSEGQQQQQAVAGRTGAKRIRLSGTADVGQAAAALAAGQPAATATAGTTCQQDVAEQTAGAMQQQQQPADAPMVPGPSDVESGPQALGVLRRKPGKGDPTLSLSCSDKLARWACLGLQGCLLSSCLEEPLYLSLLVVSAPPCSMATAASAAGDDTLAAAAAASSSQQQENQPPPGACVGEAALAAVEAAARRAVAGRLAGCKGLLRAPFAVRPPAVAAVGPPDASLGLSSSLVRKSPQGVSVNWSCQLPLLTALQQPPAKPSAAAAAGVHEVTLSAVGRKTGPVKNDAVLRKKRSRLAPAALYEQWQALTGQQAAAGAVAAAGKVPPGGAERGGFSMQQYRSAKEQLEYSKAWRALRTQPGSPFAGWIIKG